MLEKENSYIFSTKNITKIIPMNKIPKSNINIEDHYIYPNKRIRTSIDNKQNKKIQLTHKIGNKKKSRIEINKNIENEMVANTITQFSKLQINKTRYIIINNNKITVSLDFVQSPLKICVVEVEAKDPNTTLPTLKELFNLDYEPIKCPLSAWDFHKRKIGLCGGPSSGKTETAKNLSFLINTQLKGNSYKVEEYATNFIQTYNEIPNIYDQMILFDEQYKREKTAESKCNILITDSPTFLGYIYTCINNDMEFNNNRKRIFENIYKKSLETITEYTDLIFMKQPDVFVDNKIRYGDIDLAYRISNKIHMFLEDHQVPFLEKDYNDNILQDLFFING